METYEKISETEVKIINTKIEETIILLSELKEKLAQAEREIINQQQMANEMISRATAERDRLLLQVSEVEKLGIVESESLEVK